MSDILNIQYPAKYFLTCEQALAERINCPYLKGKMPTYQTHILRDASDQIRCVAEPRSPQPSEPSGPCSSCLANPAGVIRLNPYSKKKRGLGL